MNVPSMPVEVFYSYANTDKPLLEQLESHLSILRREGYISTWYKRQIMPGSDWQVEMDSHLNSASLILLLISSDFLASDYQYGVELKRAMQRHDANEAIVIPIVLRSCDWKGSLFEKLQPIPRDGIPLTSRHNLDEGFTEVVKEIRLMLETMLPSMPDSLSMGFPHIWQIPYPRNPLFTGREDLIQMLITAFQINHSGNFFQAQIQAISGLGGVGKTQLAVEYAYRTVQQYQMVFWVVAESQGSLLSGYSSIARDLQLPEKNARDQEIIILAVQRWLSTHTGWLLIMDNVGDLSQAQAFLPPIHNGHVLLTTQLKATGGIISYLEVNTFEREQGASFLLRRAGINLIHGIHKEANSEQIEIAGQISSMLGGLPLALDQAAAYIDEAKSSLQEYLSIYHHHRASLLKDRGNFIQSHPDSVATTWALSFKKVEQASIEAADLLRLCAFLHPDAIPEAMLVAGKLVLEEPLQQTLADAYMRSKAIAVLLNYSLVSRNAQTRTLVIHRLVQAVLIDMMSYQEKQKWSRYASDIQKAIKHCPCPIDGGQGVVLVDVSEEYPILQNGNLFYYCVDHKHTFVSNV